LAAVVNKKIVNSTTTAQALYEFITGDQMSTNFASPDSLEVAATHALNCQDPDLVLASRKLNGRPKNDAFDQFWAMMAQMVDVRVSDRRYGELLLLLLLL